MSERGKADVITLTVGEYGALSRWGRFKYRVYRNPLLLFVLGPTIHFICLLRIPLLAPPGWRRERRSIWLTNAVLAAVVFAVIRLVGLEAFVQVQLPITAISASVGMWLFYVQHQFEEGYWVSGERWDFVEAALRGSSYLKLPPLLRWFTGSIGFHHIHHLSPRIPNYFLHQCHESTPALQEVPTLGVREGLACLWLKLWDEDRERLISFREARRSAAVG
jgi:omega-6 fatty acid desaturase (delta-12 desaturase)